MSSDSTPPPGPADVRPRLARGRPTRPAASATIGTSGNTTSSAYALRKPQWSMTKPVTSGPAKLDSE